MTNSSSNSSHNSSVVSVIHSENPGTKISYVSFNGNNYDEWSRAFHLALLAKDKLGYIDGTIVKPSETASDFKLWRSTNALVTAWIYATIEPAIAKSISCRPEAKLVWDTIRLRFKQANEARIYRLKSEISTCRQGPTESLMAYYGRLTSLWDELMEHDPIPPCSCKSCPCDWVSIFETRRDKDRVRDFLMGLDDRFDNARSQIIDPRRNKQEHNKPNTGSGPRAHMAAGSSNGNSASTSRSSLNNLDRIDFNTLDARELDEITQMWKNRKTENTDRLSGPYLEDGDWCG
ncbi:uncharacterized protein LOC141591357 isoform X2 [Silene latifolia]|uniref:uncharacterized protein LOC141591357 isoform X2 n=1 Tax=Silene latifolia TaxID=37657 RepID=UPI003D76D422